MPLSYKIDGGIVSTTVTGKVEVREQIDFIREYLSDPALPSPLLILRDSRNQTGHLEQSQQQQLIRFAIGLPIDAKLAIVASADLIFGMSRIFQARVDETHNVQVFRDIEQAHEWLLQSPVSHEYPPKHTPGRVYYANTHSGLPTGRT